MSMQTINGTTRTCGLIGNPVEHTMSPTIQNFLALEMGHNVVYVPFHVRENIELAVKGAYALNLLGCNVTVPYKSQVIPYLVEVDALAKKIGAVNTLVQVDGGYKGYNTDMPGLYRAMMEDGVKIERESVLILGAGGVARSVALLVASYRAEEIIIINRTIEKAEKIAAEVNAVEGRTVARAISMGEYSELPLDKKYLAIQATSVGMYPNSEEVVVDRPDFYQRIHTGYDLIYNPSETKFMKCVKKSGGKAFGGLKMLLYQGIIAYELWNHTTVDEALIARAYNLLADGVRKDVR